MSWSFFSCADGSKDEWGRGFNKGEEDGRCSDRTARGGTRNAELVATLVGKGVRDRARNDDLGRNVVIEGDVKNEGCIMVSHHVWPS